MKKNSEKIIKYSIIITAHSEGLLLHKTLKSVFEAIKKNKEEECFEVILHADNPDQKTKKYIDNKIKNRKDIVFYENNFKDLGMSRNFSVKKAKGDIIFILDGDDLISDDWIIKSKKMIEESKELIIVHPEYNLTFGTHIYNPVLWKMEDSLSLEQDKILLAGVNLWVSMCAGKKEIFLKYPYKKAGNGFGNEDWDFNSRTRKDGIKHKVARDTIQFYRQKTDSLLSSNENNHLVQWKNPLFDLYELKKIPLPKEQQKSSKVKFYYAKRIFRKVHGVLLRTPLKIILIPLASLVKKIIKYDQKVEEKLSSYVIKKWKQINQIETQLYPFEWIKGNVENYIVIDKVAVGKTLRIIVEDMKKKPDYVFIVPWLSKGGGDKVVLNYIKALSKINSEYQIAVITTEENDNVWKNKLPQNAFLLDFGNNVKNLTEGDKEKVFSRLIIEMECKKIHLINSKYGYEFIAEHKDLIKENFELYVSIFNYDFIPGTNFLGIFDYADPYLFEIYDVVKRIFSDNKTNVKRLVERCGFEEKKFSVHYQPIQTIGQQKNRKKENNITRILWASRITDQKNPNLLVEIAKKLEKKEYKIDVYGEIYEGYSKKIFDNIESLEYKGKYDNFSDINPENYDIFLYTSLIDGVPNVILEAISAGIPVIASNEGGVSEVIIDEKTGILVNDFLKPESYISAIEKAKRQPEKMKKFSENAWQLISKQHSEKSFIENIKKDILDK